MIEAGLVSNTLLETSKARHAQGSWAESPCASGTRCSRPASTRETGTLAKRLPIHEEKENDDAYVTKLSLDAIPESGIDNLGVVPDAIDGRSRIEANNTGVE